MTVAPLETKSRKNFLAALHHQQPVGIPIDFGGTAVTGIHATCVAALRDHLTDRTAWLLKTHRARSPAPQSPRTTS